MDLKYVVITSVDRDDLRDGGAAHFAACVAAAVNNKHASDRVAACRAVSYCFPLAKDCALFNVTRLFGLGRSSDMA